MARERSVCLGAGLVFCWAAGARGQVEVFVNDFDGWGEAFGGTERRVEGVRGCGRSRPALPTISVDGERLWEREIFFGFRSLWRERITHDKGENGISDCGVGGVVRCGGAGSG
jgi:hypothetical protein